MTDETELLRMLIEYAVVNEARLSDEPMQPKLAKHIAATVVSVLASVGVSVVRLHANGGPRED